MKNFEGYTELEKKMINGIEDTWWCNGCDCTYLDSVADEIGISMKVARGVISSLIKKGIVLECLAEYGFEINLTNKGRELLEIEEE